MRIQGPIGSGNAGTSTTVRRASSGSFSVQEQAQSLSAGMATPPRTVGGIDALIALQGVAEDPADRRRRAVKHGRLALDALDELKIGLLGGTLTATTLSRLQSAAVFLKDGSGEAALDEVLGEIEVRVEVEIAKMAAR